jgi:transcriptional regulator with XRE-family HTH domain
MTKVNKQVGARIREARQEHAYTQEILAAELRMNIMAISKKERGIDAISAEQLWRLSRLLKRPMEWFMQDVKR